MNYNPLPQFLKPPHAFFMPVDVAVITPWNYFLYLIEARNHKFYVVVEIDYAPGEAFGKGY